MFPKLIFFKLLQFKNIFCIVFTLDVSKNDKSRYSNFWQPLNIENIASTLLVLKLERFNDGKL